MQSSRHHQMPITHPSTSSNIGLHLWISIVLISGGVLGLNKGQGDFKKGVPRSDILERMIKL